MKTAIVKLTVSQKLLILLYAIGVVLFCHHFIARPLILDWGSTKKLRSLSFAGDIPSGETHTRAILIESTPEKIWPWIIQLGQERGGMYSYELLENLVGADMHNIYQLRREFQNPRFVGDTIWLADQGHFSGKGFQIIAELTPMKSFVMVGGKDFQRWQEGGRVSGSWALYLVPETESTTWLVVRSSNGKITQTEKLLRYLFFEVPHFIMEQKMMRTIRDVAEMSGKKF